MNTNLLLILLLLTFGSCQKYLDAKPDQRLSTPETIRDLSLLLDNTAVFNLNQPGFGVMSADDYFISTKAWEGLPDPPQQLIYHWASSPLYINDWLSGYKSIFYANTALDELKRLGATGAEADRIRGTAFFYRAFVQHLLIDNYTAPYNPATQNSLGIPIKISSDYTEATTRPKVKDNFEALFSDLHAALRLLPVTALLKTRPGQVAVHALLARVYLTLGDYTRAAAAATAGLDLHSTLLNYNGINVGANTPFVANHPEVIFTAQCFRGVLLTATRARIDSVLYDSYSDTDLRKTAFFRKNVDGYYQFKGSYDPTVNGASGVFCGLSTNELWLIRAECRVRLQDIAGATSDLDSLRLRRYTTDSFIPTTESDQDALLQLILTERRKELCMRSTRWSDLRRLNALDEVAIVPERLAATGIIRLESSAGAYSAAIPDDIIRLSGIEQNKR